MTTESSMHRATYDDAVLVGRILDMRADVVWAIIRGMNYSYYSDLKVAVLNSPFRLLAEPGLRYDA